MGATSVKEPLKRALGPVWVSRARRLSRLRWITKYRLMRSLGTDIGWRGRLTYVLLDPETESFSYELENRMEMIGALASALGRPQDELAAYAAEADHDPELNDVLARRVRRRVDVKHHLPLGHRLAWYVMARALQPETIVETGIYLGLGSLALLRALERNERDGSPGTLISIDANPDAGTLVPPELRAHWHLVTGLTSDRLLPGLEGRRVGLFIQDTAHTEENQRLEFDAALAYAAESITLVDASGGWAPTLRELCVERGGTYHRVPVRSRAHVYPGLDVVFGLFERATPQPPVT